MLRSIMRSSLILAAALLAACGGKSAPATIETTQFNPVLGVDLSKSTKLPSGMYIRDLAAGTGAALANGQVVKVHYVGALPNGTIFDSNGASDDPYSFKLGAGVVIAGWDQGLVGAAVGATRQLIIPPSLGYGSLDLGVIPPDSILVFSVAIVSAQ